MQKLNLPPYDVQLREIGGKLHIFDAIRKKFLVLTPEEWVRQHFLHFLINKKGFPKSLIKMESGLKYHERQKRTDIVIFDRKLNPLVLVECKAPDVKINESTYQQITSYYSQIQAKVMVISNGLEHYCFKPEKESFKYLDEIPSFEQLI